MYGIAILDSGNYALRLCRLLENKGYIFEVISTPCQIAKHGCSYSLKFPLEYMNVVIREAELNNMRIEIYRVEPHLTKNRYVRIY